MSSDQAEILQAACRAISRIAATQSAMPAPDALRARVGAADALLVCEGAGMNPEQIKAQWAAEAAAPVQQPRQQPQLFSSDPMHHPAVVDAQVRGGDVKAALREVAEDPAVPALCRQKASIALDILAAGHYKRPGAQDPEIVTSIGDAMEAASAEIVRRGHHVDPGRKEGLPAPALFGAGQVTAGPDGVPRQGSATHTAVPELGVKK